MDSSTSRRQTHVPSRWSSLGSPVTSTPRRDNASMIRRNATERRLLLSIDRRAMIFSAIGAALYAAVSLLPNPIDLPGLHNLNFRPGVVVPVLAGILLGPIAGFFVGAAGTLVADGLTFDTSWNWAIGNGLIGLIAGVVPAAKIGRAHV